MTDFVPHICSRGIALSFSEAELQPQLSKPETICYCRPYRGAFGLLLRVVAKPLILFHLVLLVLACGFAIRAVAENSAAGIRVAGSGTPPQLGFACCDQGIGPMQAMMSNSDVIADLKDLHAEVAVPTEDFSPERAEVVRQLNQDGIPVIAWLVLSKTDGVYLNADNAPQAAARVAAFEKWTNENGLKWEAVGLDIEPNFNEFAAFKGRRLRLILTLLERSLNFRRAARARREYTELIRQIQAPGYPVQTYLMPYVPAERSVHSALPDRMLGTVEVRGNEEYLMLYTSNARAVGAGMIWSLGPHAQGIAVGVTDGDGKPGSGTGPLDWDEFSRDLIVASHFTDHIGIYNLEGCVKQGFLPRLKAMDWSQSVIIPEASVKRAERVGLLSRSVLWIASNLLYLLLAVAILIGWRWGVRKRKREPE